MTRRRTRRERVIPFRYVTVRVAKLMREGYLGSLEVWAAAMFCYFEEHQWLDHANMGSNFPRGYKVQSSVKNFNMTPNSVRAKPTVGYDILQAALIDGETFARIALRRNLKGSPRTLHRYGRELLRRCLKNFACELED